MTCRPILCTHSKQAKFPKVFVCLLVCLFVWMFIFFLFFLFFSLCLCVGDVCVWECMSVLFCFEGGCLKVSSNSYIVCMLIWAKLHRKASNIFVSKVQLKTKEKNKFWKTFKSSLGQKCINFHQIVLGLFTNVQLLLFFLFILLNYHYYCRAGQLRHNETLITTLNKQIEHV